MIEVKADPWLLAKASLRYFTVEFLGLKWPSHYSEWQAQVETKERGLFEAPRGSWKTYFFSLAYPLWNIIRGKTEVLLSSDSEGQAQKNLRLIRETIESREQLAAMRPSTKELWGVDKISFPNGSLISIMGFGTSKRGLHPDLIINDDIEGENNKMGRDDRDRIYFGVISGMATPKTKIFTVGTPMEFGDILQQLSKNPVYSYWRRPAVIEDVNQYPDLWTDDWVKNFRRQEMGSINYAREMLLERIDPATQPFKRQYETTYELPPPRERFMFVGTICDPAYSEGEGDYSAVVTAGITHGNHAYVLACDRIRKEDPGLIVDKMTAQIEAWKPDSVGMKRRKGDAISFTFNEWRIRNNQWDFRYVEIADSKSKSDSSRIGGLVPRWEAKSIHVGKWMTDFLEECYQFRLNDSHAHDDMLDAFADIFNPDMAKPNTGKRWIPSEAARIGRPLIQVGRTYTRTREDIWKGFDKRVYDHVA